MTRVGLRELRQEASDIVRRVETGEVFEITVSGRLAARMVPARLRQWQSWDDIVDLFSGPVDSDWDGDGRPLDQTPVNPWDRA